MPTEHAHHYPIWQIFHRVNVGHQVSFPRWQNKYYWQLDILAIDRYVTSIDYKYFLLIFYDFFWIQAAFSLNTYRWQTIWN